MKTSHEVVGHNFKQGFARADFPSVNAQQNELPMVRKVPPVRSLGVHRVRQGADPADVVGRTGKVRQDPERLTAAFTAGATER